jgi:hypothetical protein
MIITIRGYDACIEMYVGIKGKEVLTDQSKVPNYFYMTLEVIEYLN